MNLYLIGYRGTGKSTVAQLLARKLDRPWFDADALLEEMSGRTIRQIFAEEGEVGFRNRETNVLRDLAARDGLIVATGGGVILREENRLLLTAGRVVWLTASPDVLWQRLQRDKTTAERRPDLMQGGIEEVHALLQARLPLYLECASFQIATDEHLPEKVADLVIDWLRDKKEANASIPE